MRHIVLAAGLAVSLSACASTYVGKPYDRAAAQVSTVAVADDSVPAKITAWEVANAGSNFGLIGALANASITASREAALNEALTGAGFDAEAKLEARLAEILTAEGYAASVVAGPDRDKRVHLTAFPASETRPDAYLDLVVTNYGYLSAGVGQPWRPTVSASVRLVSATDATRVLMENQIVYNGMYVQRGVITLTPNPDYAFKNREDMLSDPNRLAAGLEDALNQVADTAVRLLK